MLLYNRLLLYHIQSRQVKKFLALLLLLPFVGLCQAPTDAMSALFSKMDFSQNIIPEKLLSSRSIVVYNDGFTEKEFGTMQSEFQRIGVDAVAYYDAELFFAGKDVEKGLYTYIVQRDVANILFIRKKDILFQLALCAFDKNEQWISQNQAAWYDESANLIEVLRNLYRQSWAQQKKQNYLINDFAERNLPFTVFSGRRSEFFALDLKVDQLAVPLFADSVLLASILKEYPFKFGIVDKTWNTQKLRQEGYLYELSYIYAKGRTARSLLGYEVKEGESGFVSINFSDGKSQLKTYAAEIPVYKFYVKQVVNGNVFLGTNWDADPDWQKALENHIRAFKAELQIR